MIVFKDKIEFSQTLLDPRLSVEWHQFYWRVLLRVKVHRERKIDVHYVWACEYNNSQSIRAIRSIRIYRAYKIYILEEI